MIKRKNKEMQPCFICGKMTKRKINFHSNNKRQYDVFVCKNCRPRVAG